jgi:TetR/AcrR family transcriptional regulator, transcriptional repressor of aconitase
MSTGAIYRYFPSKTDLVLAIVESRDGTVDGEYDDNERPSELITRLLGYVGPNDSGIPHARLSAQIWGDAAVNPAFAKKVRERHGALRDQLASRVRATTEHPRQSDESTLAEVLLAALIGYAALVATESPVDTDAFERTLLRLLPHNSP